LEFILAFALPGKTRLHAPPRVLSL
jgi:hypothetical protein